MYRQRPFEPPFYQPQNSDFNDSPLDAEIASVLFEIREEIEGLEASPEFGNHYRNAKRLLAQEAAKLENNVDPEWLELDIEKQIKLVKKVLIPQFRYPRFNFVGKIIGPKGVTLQNIAKTFKCHVYVLGRGSTRDRAKEQELLASGDPTYAHYSGPLHVKIETTAAPALAYKRVAGVMEVLAQLLQPVKETFIEGITPPLESAKKECVDSEETSEAQSTDKSMKVPEYAHDVGTETMTASHQDEGNKSLSASGPGSLPGFGRGGASRGRGGRGRGGGGSGPISSDPYRGPPSQNLNRGGGGAIRRGNPMSLSCPPAMSMPMPGPLLGMPMPMNLGGAPMRGGGGNGRGGNRGGGFRGNERGRMRFHPY